MSESISIVQKIRVEASDKDGYAVVIQSVPSVSPMEYRYEVQVGMVEQLIDALDNSFKQAVESMLDVGEHDDEEID